jgi:hypothetical protein
MLRSTLHMLNRYYTKQDVSLGQFLLDSCFNQSLKCQNVNCKRSVRDHVLGFIHGSGRVNITVGRLPHAMPTATAAQVQ